MISERGLGALRAAATLTHAVPGLRARVRQGDRVLLHVRKGAEGEEVGLDGVPAMTPCAFRCAVARAHQHQQEGRRMAFLGLPAGVEPAIDIGTPPCGASRPGALYRVPVTGGNLWAFATTIDPEVAHDLGRPLVEELTPLPGLDALGLRPDTGTGVSVAFAKVTAAPGSTAEGTVIALLEGLLATWTTHELLDSLDGLGRDGTRAV